MGPNPGSRSRSATARCRSRQRRLQGAAGGKIPLALAAALVVKAEIGDAFFAAGPGQGNLFGGLAVGQQTVATDDERALGV